LTELIYRKVKLHFRTMGYGESLFIMHGVFGSSDNWQTLGKVFSEKNKIYLLDLRNHGKSPHSDDFDYDFMVADILELMDDEKIQSAHILGHSMGGKVAMNLATKHPERVKKLIVVDIAPKYYPPHHQQIFEGFNSVDLNSIESRKDADDQIKKVISDIGVRQFLLKNLERTKDGFEWKLNVAAIQKAIENMGEGLEQKVSFDGQTLFIAGGKSDYIVSDDHEAILRVFPNAAIETIEGAGHWVHAEKPKELANSVLEFLS